MAADDLRDSVPADLDTRIAAFLSNHVPVSWTHCSCGEPFPAQRHNLHVGEELAEAVRMFTTPLMEELDRLSAEAARLQALNDEAWGSVHLHGRWSWLTKNMTTEQREYAADCVARWSAALNADDPNLESGEPEGLRWWREPERPPCTCHRLPMAAGQTCNAHQIKEIRHDS